MRPIVIVVASATRGVRPRQARRRERVHRYCARIGLFVGFLFPACVLAQVTIPIPVTVLSTDSMSQAATLGSAALASGSMEIDELERIMRYVRQAERHERNLQRIAALEPYRVASLAPVSSGSGSDVPAAFSHWNAFSNADYRFGHHDRTNNAEAGDFQRYGVLVGADYRVNPDFVLGLSAGYKHSNHEFDVLSGRTDADNFSLSGFASAYLASAWFVDGIVRGSRDEYDTRRPVSGGTAYGSTTGRQYALSVGTGYELTRRALTVVPSLRLRYTDAAIGRYTERAPGDSGLSYKHQTIRSFTSYLGATASYAVNTRLGVLMPQLTGEWVHEFENDPRYIDALPMAGKSAFSIPVDARDSNYFRIAAGTTAILPHGVMVFVHYEALLALAYKTVNTFTVGVRLEL